jgi:hypothetical protein
MSSSTQICSLTSRAACSVAVHGEPETTFRNNSNMNLIKIAEIIRDISEVGQIIW